MTRLSLLEDQKAIFVAQKEELENKRGDIYVREQQAMTDALLPFFSGFSPYAYIEVSRGSVYFKADHPDLSYKKELFNLYLRENWNYVDGEENRKSYNGIDLSYYTTSTKGVDAWELRRLRMLGDLAEIVLNDQDKMLDAINSAVLPFKEEYDRVNSQIRLINQAIRELDEKILNVKKEKIQFDLMNEGVEFEKEAYIQLKFNYTARVKSIKLVDVSKSGKKATAIFQFTHHNTTSREENVSVNSIIDQVLGFTKNIVQPVLAE
jgi:uncharacterized coiled-coil protein SlyX